MSKLLFFIGLCCSGLAYGQTTWKKIWEFPVDSSVVWDVDPAKNSYINNTSSISKRDVYGKIVLEQSIKSIGQIEKIDASNLLKIAIFSEDQQRICFVDNALAIQGNCIELIDQDIQLAQTFCYSNQIDRLWIFDQVNAALKLITTHNNQQQRIENIRALVDLKEVVDIQEFNNEIYLIDSASTVAHFDNFGSLMDVVKLPVSGCVQASEYGLLFSQGTMIFFHNKENETNQEFFALPEGITQGIQHFKLVGTGLFVSTKTAIYYFEFVK